VDERRRGVPSDAAVSRAMQADDHQSCQETLAPVAR
jgi:hypothetical protein